MARRPKRAIVLAALALLLVAVAAIARAWWESNSSVNASSPPSTARPSAGAGPKPAGLAAAVEPVALDALKLSRPEPVGAARNPFRFRPKPPSSPEPPRPSSEQPGTPAAPPPPVRIALKFIGVVDAPNAGPLAILSDPRGVYQGHEGDIIDGRYRILKIGVESIDLAYLDGRGRQTIRLTGQ